MIEFISQLPTEYQEVEYIQSSGTQYINLNFIPNQDTGIEMNVIPMQVTAANAGVGFIPYGAGQSYNSNTFECYSTPDGYLEFNYAQQHQTQLVAISIGTKIKIFQNKNNVLVYNEAGNIILNHNFTYSNFTSPQNLVIFGINRGNILCGHQKIYDCKIFNNNNKIYELIPCYRKTDKIAGMYDLVNNVFYTNAGSGVFAVGADSNKHAIATITPGGVIPMQYALRRRMMINASKGLSISSLPLGTLIRIADSDGGKGDANYEIADINNLVPGGVVLVRKNIYSQSKFGSNTSYPGSTLDNFIGTTIFGRLPQKLRDKMMDVTFKTSNYSDITRKMFALTWTMMGFVNDDRFAEGKALQLYTSNASRIKNGYWWLSSWRSTGPSGKAWSVDMNGILYSLAPSASCGVVPAFAIPSDTPYNVTPNTDGSYNLAIDTGTGSETITGTDVILNIITGETEDGNTNELGTIGFAKDPTTTFANRASSNEWQTVTVNANTVYTQNTFQFNGSFTIGVEITNTLDNSLIDKVIDFWNGNTDESVINIESINDGTKITAQYTVERDATQQTVVDFEVVADPEIAATVTFTNSSTT